MKLVLTSIDTDEQAHPPLSLGYIASYLKKYLNFNNISVVDREADMAEAVIAEKPDILGISSITREFNNSLNLAKRVKEKIDIPIIIGGSHISALPSNLHNIFDIGVIGEGEQTMLELIDLFLKRGRFDKSELKNIKGICYHNGKISTEKSLSQLNNKEISAMKSMPQLYNNIKVTERRELIKNIDIVPFPTRELFNMEKHYLVRRNAGTARRISRATSILTSRGCPFNCVYCASSCFWGRRIRYHSPEYVVGEIKEIIEKYKVEEIFIQDDLFVTDKNRLKKIVELIKGEKINDRVRFLCTSRADTIDEETCKLLKEMGVVQLNFGFESGSPKTLKYLKKNTTTVEQNKRAVDLGKKYGFDVLGFFMIGAPYETKEDMLMTLDFIRSNPIDISVTFPITPFPGTDIWEHCKERGLVSDNMNWKKIDFTKKDGVFMNEKMSREEFLKMLSLFQKETDKTVYNVNFKFSDLFSSTVFKYLITHPRKSWNFVYYSVLKKMRKKFL